MELSKAAALRPLKEVPSPLLINISYEIMLNKKSLMNKHQALILCLASWTKI
jgi:hypothetical protein